MVDAHNYINKSAYKSDYSKILYFYFVNINLGMGGFIT